MRPYSKCVSLLSFESRNKENLFLVKIKMAFQNLLSLPIICSEIQELYLWKKANHKPTMTFWVSCKAVFHPLSQSSSLPCFLCTFSTPSPPISRGWEMGNQSRSHCFLGNTAFTNPLSAPVAPMTDPLPSFCTLAPSPLPPPTSCVKKIFSPPYLKLSSTFCCFFINI